MLKRVVILTISFLFSILSFGLTFSYAQSSPPNYVGAELGHGSWYHTKEDSTQNVYVSWQHQMRAQISNSFDSSNQNVDKPIIKLTTDVPLTSFIPYNFPNQDNFGFGRFYSTPPNYTWDFYNLTILPYQLRFVSGFEENPFISEKTKFSAKRSVVPEILTQAETLQSVSFEFTLEEALPPEVTRLQIRIGSPQIAGGGMPLVQGAFISATPVDGWTSGFDPTGAIWHINPSNIVIGKLYIFEAVMKSTKSPNLGGSPLFKPGVLIHYARTTNYPPTTGQSVSFGGPDGMLSGTFTAVNPVTWNPFYMDNRWDFWFDPVVSEVIPNPTPPPPYIVLVPATVRIEPETLMLNTGVFTAFVNLPYPYDVRNIDVASIKCEGASPRSGVIANNTLILKFARADLVGVEPGEDVEFVITGRLIDEPNYPSGSGFKGYDIIRVINE